MFSYINDNENNVKANIYLKYSIYNESSPVSFTPELVTIGIDSDKKVINFADVDSQNDSLTYGTISIKKVDFFNNEQVVPVKQYNVFDLIGDESLGESDKFEWDANKATLTINMDNITIYDIGEYKVYANINDTFSDKLIASKKITIQKQPDQLKIYDTDDIENIPETPLDDGNVNIPQITTLEHSTFERFVVIDLFDKKDKVTIDLIDQLETLDSWLNYEILNVPGSQFRFKNLATGTNIDSSIDITLNDLPHGSDKVVLRLYGNPQTYNKGTHFLNINVTLTNIENNVVNNVEHSYLKYTLFVVNNPSIYSHSIFEKQYSMRQMSPYHYFYYEANVIDNDNQPMKIKLMDGNQEIVYTDTNGLVISCQNNEIFIRGRFMNNYENVSPFVYDSETSKLKIKTKLISTNNTEETKDFTFDVIDVFDNNYNLTSGIGLLNTRLY